MTTIRSCRACGVKTPFERIGGHDRFHWKRFWTRFRAGTPIGVPRTMFMGVSGRKIGLFPTNPTIHRRWKTWLRTFAYSDALVYVVVCDNLGDPLPNPMPLL